MPVFENEKVLVVDKRVGYLSVVSRMGRKETRPCEFLEWSKKLERPLWSVHRLDEVVSGLLVLAKDPKSHALLSQAFEERDLKKTYEAWTEVGKEPVPQKEKIRWESTLLRGKKRAYEKPFGKKAITEAFFQGIGNFEGETLWTWELEPLTGRSHQLRFECAKHGFPIWGDVLYGSTKKFNRENAIALRAIRLDFSQVRCRETLGLPLQLEASSLIDWLRDPVNAH